jgi:hypothetical protein
MKHLILDLPQAANDNKPKYISTNHKHSHTLLTWLMLDEEDAAEWPTFEHFVNDVYFAPSAHWELVKRNEDLPHGKENSRWVRLKTQAKAYLDDYPVSLSHMASNNTHKD